MAQLDTNIAMGFRPVQIESPFNQMAAISQLETARQQREMNALKLKEYQAQIEDKNALAKIYANPNLKFGTPEFFTEVANKVPRLYSDIVGGYEKQQNALGIRAEREQKTEKARQEMTAARRTTALNRIASAKSPQIALALAQDFYSSGDIDLNDSNDLITALSSNPDWPELQNQIKQGLLTPEKALTMPFDIAEAKTRSEKSAFDLEREKKKVSVATVNQAIADIAGLDSLPAIYADIDKKIVSGEITEEQGNQIRGGLPSDEAGVPAWQRATLIKLLDLKDRVASQREEVKFEQQQTEFEQKQADRTAPKWTLTEVGGRKVMVDTNSRSPTAGQIKPDTEALVDKTPKYTARDIGGKIVYVDENPDSPTFGQQKTGAELTKTAAPTAVTESPLARLERELADAVKTHGANSQQAKNIRNKIEQETGGLERQRIDIDRQRLKLERYKANNGDGRGPGPGTKLEKGEIWNEAEQRIETVPGSKLNIAQSNAHNKDRDALKAVETKTNSAIAKIDELLSPKYIDSFRANFSGDIPFSGYISQYAAPDARRRLDSLKSDMKAAGLELIRAGGSIGQITEREWPIIEGMIAKITPDMDYNEAELQVKKVRAYLKNIQDNAKDSYETQWSGTQYYKPTGKTPAKALTSVDKQALDWANANPKDPRAAAIKKRLGVK